MNKKRYSQILDVVAGDQVPKDLDLAPNIMARIQKRKGFRMQPRTKFVSAALLVAIVLVVLFYTVPGMAAAIGRWFGYVPGVGLVREGQIRVLAEPVSVTRDGVTVTVDQVVLDPERTALVYSVEGIPSAARSTQGPADALPLRGLAAPAGGLAQSARSWPARMASKPGHLATSTASITRPCRPPSTRRRWSFPACSTPGPARRPKIGRSRCASSLPRRT